MTFKQQLLQPIEGLVRIDSDTGRVYQKDGKLYRSVTSMLSGLSSTAITNWQNRVGMAKAEGIKRQAGNRGAAVHKLCEQYLLNQPVESSMPIFQDDFNKAKRLLDRHIDTVMAVEFQMYSDQLSAAGTSDLIAVWNPQLMNVKPCIAIVDFKTSSRPLYKEKLRNYFIQECAYAIMLEELFGIFASKLVIINLDQSAPTPTVYQVSTIDYYQKTKQIFQVITKQLNSQTESNSIQ